MSVLEVVTRQNIKKILPVIVGVGLLLIGALAIYAILVGPSKQPYREALTQYRNVYDANVAFTNAGAAINASGASNEQFTKNITTLRSALKGITTENEALGKKAVLTSGEGQHYYKAFTEKLAAYTAYNTTVIDAIEVLRPVLYECSGTMNSVTQDAAGASALRNCAAEMQKRTIPDPDYAQLARSFIESYNGAATAIEKRVALSDPTGADKAAATMFENERDEFVRDLTTASTNLAKNLQKSREKVDITNSAMALDNYLKAKSSVF